MLPEMPDAKGCWGEWMKHFWLFNSKTNELWMDSVKIAFVLQDKMSPSTNFSVSNCENGFFFKFNGHVLTGDPPPWRCVLATSSCCCKRSTKVMVSTSCLRKRCIASEFPPEETGNCSLSWWPKLSPFGTLPHKKWLLGVAKNSENQFDVTNIPNEASKCIQCFPAFLLPHLFGNVSSINSKGPIRDPPCGWSLNHHPQPPP